MLASHSPRRGRWFAARCGSTATRWMCRWRRQQWRRCSCKRESNSRRSSTSSCRGPRSSACKASGGEKVAWKAQSWEPSGYFSNTLDCVMGPLMHAALALTDTADDGDVLDIQTFEQTSPAVTGKLQPSDSERALRTLKRKSFARNELLGKESSIRNTAAAKDEEDAAANVAAPRGLPGCRLGVFVVAPLKAENLATSSRFRMARISLTVRLLPYEETHTTATAAGPVYAWTSPIKFTHVDPTRSGLIIQIKAYDEPPLGHRVLIGRSYIVLEGALDSPGVSVVQWMRVDRMRSTSSDPDDCRGGRILVAVCYHPKVSKGPTVRALLHSIAHAEVDPSVEELSRKSQSMLHSLLTKARRRCGIGSVEAAVMHEKQALRRAKGSFTFRLQGIHICGPQCSKIDGHSTLSFLEFSPTAVIRFEGFEYELPVNAAHCDDVMFEHEWPVYSSFAQVEVDIYKRVGLGAGSNCRRLLDGSVAMKVCGLAITCFEIQEQVAASWTLDQLTATLGPGKHPPQQGFRWYPLIMGDEEVGLAQVAAKYSEDLLAMVDSEENPDLSFVPQDEQTFDPAIIQRNFERLDDLFLFLKEIKAYWDDTLDWKQPIRTVVAWTCVNGSFFFVPADHFPLLAILAVIATLAITFIQYVRGCTHKRWIEQSPSLSRLKNFRPIGTLRFAPLRASHLVSIEGTDEHPDIFVRIFYEPNYKKIPVHQVAQSECARRTKNPDWTRPQRDTGREDFLRSNNGRLKEHTRHLSSYVQDAVMHDVVEPWSRKDGTADANAFRLSILQPVEVDPSSGEDELIDWYRSPGAIRFDVVQDSAGEQNPLIGRVRIPLRSLITDEATGGAQNEIELTLPLVLPPRHAQLHVESTDTPSSHGPSNRGTATISVRLQMILRRPGERVTLRETLASEALFEAMEMEVERELSWVAKYHKAKDVAKNIQQTLGSICSTLERFKNLFLWVHPLKTLIVFSMAILGSVCFYFVPTKYFVLYSTTKAFTRKFHKAVDTGLVRFLNMLITIPSDLDMKRIYHWKNQEYLKAREHSEAQARLQGQWSGFALRQGLTWLHGWQERYCAIRGSRLEFWQSIADAKSGLPPKSFFCISNVVDVCTKAEASHIPKDSFPIVVFDVSRSLLASAPRGRRKVMCVKSEDDFRSFCDAVRGSGEPMDTATSGTLDTPPSRTSRSMGIEVAAAHGNARS